MSPERKSLAAAIDSQLPPLPRAGSSPRQGSHHDTPRPMSAWQVRSLTREVGALREALRQEEGKRERLAAHAKACDEARAAVEAKNRSLTYVNT